MQTDDGHLARLTTEDLAGNSDMGRLATKNPGLVFEVGERVMIKDGDFVIDSIGSKRMVLRGLPGTRIRK